MKIAQALFLLPLSLGFAMHVNAQEPRSITIATEGAFPPWNSFDASGELIGFDVDVGKALCERAKLNCKFIAQAWDGIIPGLTVGKYDAVMAGMSITKKREEVISFSDPYSLTSNYFVISTTARVPEIDPSTTLDLSSNSASDKELALTLRKNLTGLIIGVQGSTNAETFIRTYLGKDVEVRVYDKQDSLNLDLQAGRIDAGLADYSVWKAFLESQGGQGASVYGPRISGGIFGPGVGIGFRKQDSDLKDQFNIAIEALKKDGGLRKLSIKWFGVDSVSK